MAYKGAEDAPPSVLFLTNLGEKANRVPGQCVDVARRTADAFRNMGMDPKFVRISQAPFDYFETKAGEPVTKNGVHWAVQVGQQTYDAFNATGVPIDQCLQQFVWRSTPVG
jgi:hypothetical protein